MWLKLGYLRRTFICVCVLFIILTQSSCTNKTITQNYGQSLIVDYEQFGPPQLSATLLGQDFWQWQTTPAHSPKKYDIKVVIYRNLALSEVEKRYPVDPVLIQDYRYLEYSRAKTWIKNQISKIQEELKVSVPNEELDLIIYDFSRLENMYKLLVTLEQGLRN